MRDRAAERLGSNPLGALIEIPKGKLGVSR